MLLVCDWLPLYKIPTAVNLDRLTFNNFESIKAKDCRKFCFLTQTLSKLEIVLFCFTEQNLIIN